MRVLLLSLAMAMAPLAVASATSDIDAAVAAYERGDLVAARTAFARLARRGIPAAEYNLAVMHLRGDLPKPKPREALRLMIQSADAGFVTGIYGLGQMHELGQGGLKIDLVEANRWYQRAARAGSVEGQVAIGTAYFLGRGASKDPALAARWFRIAAQGGDVGAMYLYASMAESGDGVPRDLNEARYWYGMAARNGDEAAPSKVKEVDAKLGVPAT